MASPTLFKHILYPENHGNDQELFTCIEGLTTCTCSFFSQEPTGVARYQHFSSSHLHSERGGLSLGANFIQLSSWGTHTLLSLLSFWPPSLFRILSRIEGHLTPAKRLQDLNLRSPAAQVADHSPSHLTSPQKQISLPKKMKDMINYKSFMTESKSTLNSLTLNKIIQRIVSLKAHKISFH